MTPASRSCRKYCGGVSHDKEILVRTTPSSPVGLHRVTDPAGAVAAAGRTASRRLTRAVARRGAASTSRPSTSTRRPSGSCREKHAGDGDAVRAEVLDIVATRGKMQNPVTGSGGMLIGTVAEVGPAVAARPARSATGSRPWSRSRSPRCGITDGLARWDGRSERVPAEGTAILFGRSIAARLPEDLAPDLALMVMDVCGAPALVARVVGEYVASRDRAHRRGARRRREVGFAVARRGAQGGCRPQHRRRAGRARGRPAARQRPGRRGRRRRRALAPRAVGGRRGGGRARRRHRRVRRRPGLRAAGHPRHRRRAARSSTSRWRRASRPPRWGPRASPPTCACSSATATCPGTPTSPSTCVRSDAAVRALFEGRLAEQRRAPIFTRCG